MFHGLSLKLTRELRFVMVQMGVFILQTVGFSMSGDFYPRIVDLYPDDGSFWKLKDLKTSNSGVFAILENLGIFFGWYPKKKPPLINNQKFDFGIVEPQKSVFGKVRSLMELIQEEVLGIFLMYEKLHSLWIIEISETRYFIWFQFIIWYIC